MNHSKSNLNVSKQHVNNKNMKKSESNCECFNSYFIDIGRNLSKDINCMKNPITCVDSYHSTSFLQPYKSMGNIEKYQYFGNVQFIHQIIIKYAATFIEMSSSHMINCCLVTCVVYSKCNIVKVVPIYQCGKRDDQYN